MLSEEQVRDEKLEIQDNKSNSGENISESPLLPTPVSKDKDARYIIDKESLDIVHNIVTTNDPSSLNTYVDQFNLNMSKKNLLRILKMNELWDRVSDEAINRIENHPDEMTNMELLNFIKVAQESLNNSKKESDTVTTLHPITVNQQNNTVNVNVKTSEDVRVNRRSKEKIMDAVSKLLNISLDADAVEDPLIIDENKNTKENE